MTPHGIARRHLQQTRHISWSVGFSTSGLPIRKSQRHESMQGQSPSIRRPTRWVGAYVALLFAKRVARLQSSAPPHDPGPKWSSIWPIHVSATMTSHVHCVAYVQRNRMLFAGSQMVITRDQVVQGGPRVQAAVVGVPCWNSHQTRPSLPSLQLRPLVAEGMQSSWASGRATYVVQSHNGSVSHDLRPGDAARLIRASQCHATDDSGSCAPRATGYPQKLFTPLSTGFPTAFSEG